jgi:nicotinamidase-related amidase
MQKLLIVVDMQNDFVSGSLGSAEAKAAATNAARRIEAFSGEIFITKDTHSEEYLSTQEGGKLPVIHCVAGTPGHELCPELAGIGKLADARVFEKGAFGSVDLAKAVAEEYAGGRIGGAELIGLCTDICVVSNALLIKAFAPELPVSVDASCCAGVTPEKHRAALETMRSCQIEITGDEI